MTLSLSILLQLSGNLATLLAPPSTGQGIDGALLDDTWAFNLGTEQWEDITGQIIGDVPRRRYGAAGGSLPGAERLWLSMGRGANTRLLSDTWVLERALSERGDKLTATHYVPS